MFPASLREFRESEWPAVPGECLGHYACHGRGYENDCVPRPGEQCGDACYAMLARDCPDRPEVLAAAKSSDAYVRYHEARLAWLGEDRPGWLDEFIDGYQPFEQIRYAPFREAERHER